MSLFYQQSNQKNKSTHKNNQNYNQNQQSYLKLPTNGHQKQNKSNSHHQKILQIQQHNQDPTFPTQKNYGRQSVLLQKNQGENQSCWSKLCACTRLQYYQKFFQVTNQDVIKRILLALLFWKGQFFKNKQQQEYDFYGPFWIFTTVVFCLSAVPNIIKYQVQNPFDYDFDIIGIAFGIIYLWGFIFPALLTLLMKVLGTECTYIQIMCLYGYSMSAYILCLILCSFNVCVLHWILLLYGAGTKFIFIFKNILQGMEIPTNKKIIFTILIIIEVIIQFLIFKFKFIQCASAPEIVHASTNHHQNAHVNFRQHHIQI